MFDTNKNYWLYIAPYVYCCIKETQAILYNTKKGVSLETDDKNILVLLRRLHEKKNLGAIYCTGELLSKNPYKEFITNFCQKKMGDVVDVELMSNKPIQMMPILNLQSDINKIQKEDMGKDILHYLLELNIYLHNNCEQRCLNCDFFYRQSLCCKKDKGGQSKEILGLDVLKSILEQIQYSSVARLNLLGGNIFKYPYYSKLSDLLANCGKQIHIWNHYANFSGEKIIFADFHYEVVITFPINYQLLDYSFNLLRNNDVKYHFHITDIEEYEKSENLIKRFEINDYRIHPIYTIKNHIFFKKYIYSRHEDIYQIKLPFHRIFAHQKLNTNFFGTLTILPNCDVYANINTPALGNIKHCMLLNIIEKEIQENTAWRRIRDSLPCSKCIYQYLCPSPSSYELVIGRSNLCHIKP